MLFAFVATPLMVRGLGVENYGYFSIVLVVIGSAFTTGIARTPAKYIPEKRGAKKSSELQPIRSAAIVITFAVAAAEAIGLALLSPFLVSRVLGVSGPAGGQLTTGIYLACLIGAVMMLSHFFQAALQGIHRFRVYAMITIAASFVLNLGSVIIAANGFPFVDIFVWNLIVSFAAAAAFFVFARSGVPELTLRAAVDANALKTVGRFAASIFVYQSITAVFYLFERSYVLRNFGPEALTYYTVPLLLGLYLHSVIVAVSQVTIPKFNERLGDTSALFQIYKALTKVVVSASVYLAMLYYLVGEELLTLWLGPAFADRSFSFLVIGGAAFALIAILIPAWILSESARRPGINASSPLVTSLVGMTAIVILGSVYQIEGAAAGRLAGAIAALPIILIVERLVFERIMYDVWLAIAVRVLAAASVMFSIDIAADILLETSWPAFIFTSILISSGFWGTLIGLGYTSRKEISSAYSSAFAGPENSEMANPMQ